VIPALGTCVILANYVSVCHLEVVPFETYKEFKMVESGLSLSTSRTYLNGSPDR
jgi:hypothetical protein